MALHPLLNVDELPELEPYLARVGEVFAAFRDQDSGCISYGVHLPGDERWFVKESVREDARASLERGWVFHQAVRHPGIVPQVHRIASRGGGLAVVMPWREGEVLYHPTVHRSGGRARPGSPMSRFRALPVPEVLCALETVLDAHLAVEAAGFVAVDFYDGALLYDFTGRRMQLVDLDEYRPRPFVLDQERLPGSRRFMAPEEFERGAAIDARTTVFSLGRTARLLLDTGDEERAWRGSRAQLAVVERATRVDPGERYQTVRQFVAAWGAVPAGSGEPSGADSPAGS